MTQRLLADIEAGAGDALPLLAFTLEQLYLDYGQTGVLRLSDYEKFGGLKGTIDAAIERAFTRADADARIPHDRQARLSLLRRGLIPWLAGVDPDSKAPRRNIARRADIPPETAPLIDLLVEERLLSVGVRTTRDPRTGEETREPTIEPTQDALLRQWGMLEDWLIEDFGLLWTLEGAKRSARDWDTNARANSWLLHQGQRLVDVLALDARPDIAARLEATDRAYLAACRAREEAARAKAEKLAATNALPEISIPGNENLWPETFGPKDLQSAAETADWRPQTEFPGAKPRKCRPIPDARKLRQFGATGWLDSNQRYLSPYCAGRRKAADVLQRRMGQRACPLRPFVSAADRLEDLPVAAEGRGPVFAEAHPFRQQGEDGRVLLLPQALDDAGQRGVAGGPGDGQMESEVGRLPGAAGVVVANHVVDLGRHRGEILRGRA